MTSTLEPWLGVIELTHCNPPSTLPPLCTESSQTPWMMLGVAQYLALSEASLSEAMGSFIHRIMTAWQSQQWFIFVNGQRQPWGFMSWQEASENPNAANSQSLSTVLADRAPTDPSRGWIVDIIAPFGHQDTIEQHWAEQVGNFNKRLRKPRHLMHNLATQ